MCCTHNVVRFTHAAIEEIERRISRIKEADEKLTSHNNIEIQDYLKKINYELASKISDWRKKKTKITDTEEAKTIAAQFDADLHRFCREYCQQLEMVVNTYAGIIRNTFIEQYQTAQLDTSYADTVKLCMDRPHPEIEHQITALLSIKEESYAAARTNRIGHLFKSNDTAADSGPVLETTYYYQAWRAHMLNAITPYIDNLINERMKLLQDYSEKLSEDYHVHLNQLLEQQISLKENVASQLSEEEKQLQKDNDWLNEFIDRLNRIERS